MNRLLQVLDMLYAYKTDDYRSLVRSCDDDVLGLFQGGFVLLWGKQSED